MIQVEPFIVTDGALPTSMRRHASIIQDLVTEVYPAADTENPLDNIEGLCFAAMPDAETDVVIGVINIHTPPAAYALDETAWINALVVTQAFRSNGSNGGMNVGRQLVDRVNATAAREGMARIALEATSTSKKFWAKQGFSIAEHQPAQMDQWGTLMMRDL